MRSLLFSLLIATLAASAGAAQFRVYYYLPRGNSSRLAMVLEAPDSGTAARIFAGLLPRARISEIKQIAAYQDGRQKKGTREMKIKELIARLSELDPELDVVVGYQPRVPGPDPEQSPSDKSSVKEVRLVWAPKHFALEEPLFVELRTNADYPSRQQRNTSK